MKRNKVKKHHFGLTFIATGKETNGQYFLSETVVPAWDSGPPLHTHSKENEGFYLKKGKLKFIVNKQVIELSEGEFLNIEKGEKHSWENQSDNDAELLITFAPAGIENMFIELENSSIEDIKEIGKKYGTDFDV